MPGAGKPGKGQYDYSRLFHTKTPSDKRLLPPTPVSSLPLLSALASDGCSKVLRMSRRLKGPNQKGSWPTVSYKAPAYRRCPAALLQSTCSQIVSCCHRLPARASQHPFKLMTSSCASSQGGRKEEGRDRYEENSLIPGSQQNCWMD